MCYVDVERNGGCLVHLYESHNKIVCCEFCLFVCSLTVVIVILRVLCFFMFLFLFYFFSLPAAFLLGVFTFFRGFFFGGFCFVFVLLFFVDFLCSGMFCSSFCSFSGLF